MAPGQPCPHAAPPDAALTAVPIPWAPPATTPSPQLPWAPQPAQEDLSLLKHPNTLEMSLRVPSRCQASSLHHLPRSYQHSPHATTSIPTLSGDDHPSPTAFSLRVPQPQNPVGPASCQHSPTLSQPLANTCFPLPLFFKDL